jgi:hypothetical protein
VILPAASPGRWWQQHHAVVFPHHDAGQVGPYLLIGTEELVSEVLPALVERLVADGTPRPAAGTYLAGWYAGLAGSFLGLSLVATGAGYLMRPESTRWWRHPEGYPDALVLAEETRVAVLPGHRWSGRAEAHPVASGTELAGLAVAALVETVDPVIDALQGLTRAGRTGLWHQVADSIGSALVHQDALEVTAESVALLHGLLAAPAGPWRRRPRVELLHTAHGVVCVSQKGGCCLAYTETGGEEAAQDEDHAAFRAAFPRAHDQPNYCVTCRFRPYDESVRMQLWWRERAQPAPDPLC